MDVTPYLDLEIAPRAVFDALDERRTRPRFMLPSADGDWRAVTWGAFAKQIREAALFCTAAGMKGKDRACVYAPNRVEWMSAALGIQAAGGVIVPVYASNTAEQAAYVVEHSDARIVFVDTAPLVERVLSAWGAYGAVERIVLLAGNSGGWLASFPKSGGLPDDRGREVFRKRAGEHPEAPRRHRSEGIGPVVGLEDRPVQVQL